MALESVKGYVRSRMLYLGFQEWSDGFNFENIPGNLLDNSWHLEFGRAQNARLNQTPLQLEWPVVLRLFKGNTIDPRTLIDDMILSIDSVISDLLKASNRLSYSNGSFKNLLLESFRLEQLADSNDNGIIGIIELKAMVIMPVD